MTTCDQVDEQLRCLGMQIDGLRSQLRATQQRLREVERERDDALAEVARAKQDMEQASESVGELLAALARGEGVP